MFKRLIQYLNKPATPNDYAMLFMAPGLGLLAGLTLALYFRFTH